MFTQKINFNEEHYIKLSQNNFKGILGLTKNYNKDVHVINKLNFGVGSKYSFMNHLISNNIINQNVFSIYKDKFIIGKSFASNKLNTCQCSNDLENSYKYFFWNCKVNRISMINLSFEIQSHSTLIIDSTLIGIIFPQAMLLTIMPQISYLSKGNCENSPRLFCREERNLEIFGDLILEMEGVFEIVISLRDMFYYNEKTSRYDSYIVISDISEGITLGKSVFAKYFVEFTNEENYIGFAELETFDIGNNIKIDIMVITSLVKRKMLMWIVIGILFWGIGIVGIRWLKILKNEF